MKTQQAVALPPPAECANDNQGESQKPGFPPRRYDAAFYADDFVNLCRGRAPEALAEAERIISQLGLSLNRTKTRICNVYEEPFDFLGYSFAPRHRFGTGRKYVAAYPSVVSVHRLKVTLRKMVGNHMSWISEEQLVGEVNRVLRGWTNYFSYGTLRKSYTGVVSPKLPYIC